MIFRSRQQSLALVDTPQNATQFSHIFFPRANISAPQLSLLLEIFTNNLHAFSDKNKIPHTSSTKQNEEIRISEEILSHPE